MKRFSMLAKDDQALRNYEKLQSERVSTDILKVVKCQPEFSGLA